MTFPRRLPPINAGASLFRCAMCKGPLSPEGRCGGCGLTYPRRNGYPVLLPPSERLKTSQAIAWRTALEGFRTVRSAPTPDSHEAQMARIRRLAAFASPWLAGKERVLDVGCGVGTPLREGLVPAGRYWGIDPLPVLPAVSAFPFAQAISEFLPFEDATFDALLVLGTLDHVLDLRATLRECRRVLKPGGPLLMGLSLHEKEAGSIPFGTPRHNLVRLWHLVQLLADFRFREIHARTEFFLRWLPRSRRAERSHTFHFSRGDLAEKLAPEFRLASLVADTPVIHFAVATPG